MKNLIQIAAITLVAVVFVMSCKTTSGLSDVEVNTLKGIDVNFAKYQSFYLLPEPPDGATGQPVVEKSFERQIVEDAVLGELAARKYKQVNDEALADMLVAIQFSLKDEKKRVTISNSSYGENGYYSNSYGYNYRSYYGYETFPTTTSFVRDYRRGNMIVDLIDKEKNALIWEGHAQGKGETDIDAIQTKVNKVVAEMFSRYPVVPEG